MSTKRKYQESDSRAGVHESRQLQVYGEHPKAAKRRRRTERDEQIHASSVNTIKRKIRDVTRALERGGEAMSADMRLESERALAAYQQELAAAETEKMRQQMIKKYHMVRFFERQKATRLLKQIKKRLLAAESTEDVEALQKQMHEVEVDLNYTQYHPLMETYIGLYSRNNDTEDEASKDTQVAASKPKPPIWLEVERCMKEGTLDRLRNRVSNTPASIPKPVEFKPAKSAAVRPGPDTSGMNRRQRRAQLEGTGSSSKSKSTGFENIKTFGSWQKEPTVASGFDQDEDSGGEFFE